MLFVTIDCFVLVTEEMWAIHSSTRKRTSWCLCIECHSLPLFVNRYYVLRDDMLGYYMHDIVERLSTRQDGDGWEVRDRFSLVYATLIVFVFIFIIIIRKSKRHYIVSSLFRKRFL
jgi:hypothetical protein